MTETDDLIIARILQHEGSAYTNDPDDAGGPTRWGITQVNLASWRGHPVTPEDVKALERDEAAAIYRAQYIRPFDTLKNFSVHYNIIDMGVNAGVRKAITLLQELVGSTVDGWIGPETLLALQLFDDVQSNVLYVGFRLSFYESLIVARPTQKKWRKGWRTRAISYLTVDAKPKAQPTTQASFKMARAA